MPGCAFIDDSAIMADFFRKQEAMDSLMRCPVFDHLELSMLMKEIGDIGDEAKCRWILQTHVAPMLKVPTMVNLNHLLSLAGWGGVFLPSKVRDWPVADSLGTHEQLERQLYLNLLQREVKKRGREKIKILDDSSSFAGWLNCCVSVTTTASTFG